MTLGCVRNRGTNGKKNNCKRVAAMKANFKTDTDLMAHVDQCYKAIEEELREICELQRPEILHGLQVGATTTQ